MGLWTAAGQALTGSDPTNDDGFDLSLVRPGSAVLVEVCADGGNCTNLTIQAWKKNHETGNWARAPQFDFTAAAVGKKYVAFVTGKIEIPKGRMVWVSNGSTVSAGTTLSFLGQAL